MAAFTYQYLADGSIRRDDGRTFPNIAGSSVEHDMWAAFMAGGGTTTAVAAVLVADARTAAKLQLNHLAEVARAAVLAAAGITTGDLQQVVRYQEARLYKAIDDLSGTPDAADYKVLGAEVTAGIHVDLATAVDAANTELTALSAQLANLEAQRLGFHEDVDDAADTAAVAVVMAAVEYDADTP